MEREYRDGTEPTVLPHLDQRDIHPMRVCRGWGCQQGRLPCPTPATCVLAAEASTELGEEDPPTVSSEIERILVITIVVASCAAVIGFIGGLLS